MSLFNCYWSINLGELKTMDDIKKIEIELVNGLRITVSDKNYEILKHDGKVTARKRMSNVERITEPVMT